MPRTELIDVENLANRIPDGALLALPADRNGVALAATRALIRRRAQGLRILTVPTSGMQSDLLIGAGCVAEVETSGVSLSEYGPAPRFGAAVSEGTIVIRDATCPAVHAGLQASEKGVPFLPLRGILGTDVLKFRPDWRVIDNPFEAGSDPIVLVAAVQPDIALFHVARADRHGNVFVGRERDLVTMAHASRRTLITAEQIVDVDLMHDPAYAAGTLSSFYVEAVAEAPRGAWPLGLHGCYAEDAEHLTRYASAAATPEGFRRYLDEFVFATRAAAQ
ncbi:MAG: CoA synthetase [Alphaproteobacteria bacterium]|nr:CoA synthetase [Alphaproteobacteria bacterium]